MIDLSALNAAAHAARIAGVLRAVKLPQLGADNNFVIRDH
jgi:hypothetical protein